MGDIAKAVGEASARELFDLARHMTGSLQIARDDGQGLFRLSTGDVAEVLLDWAEEEGLTGPGAAAAAAKGPQEGFDETSELHPGNDPNLPPMEGTHG
ncbi:hypothetical protein [Pseudoroseicyclus tamaricis]|uniref:Uncharacterized protein n=1 Tax=Pseudoroseicyclus tamaricis TaxID=2705421 RepID=A0A6B2JUE4_9RHOB|nr:hypothetical protein [Pseudoroseicyclus tamaricis]NDV01680.1 hypothetical protein [Pseudoroseicyclus tamaricis]